MKFTDRGGRVVVAAAAEGSALVLAVEDTGVGISAGSAARRQSVLPGARRLRPPHDGTGLGLSIVKGLVALHGGALDITSVGWGTRVTVRLPLDCEQARRSERTAVIERLPRAGGGHSRHQVKKRA